MQELPAAVAATALKPPAMLAKSLQPAAAAEFAAQLASSQLDAQSADALASEMFAAAIQGPDEAASVAQLLAEVLALCPGGGGSGKQLRRLVLTRCEQALDVTPPPGMNRSYQEKMAAMAFLAALLNAGVVPPSVMHSCLAELLRGSPDSAVHDLECFAMLLSATGHCLEAESLQSKAQVRQHCEAVSKKLDEGVVGASTALTAKLRELLVLCEAGWPQPQAPTPAAPAAPPVAVAVQQQPAVPLPMPLGRTSQPPSSAHPGAAAAAVVEAEADAAADDSLANIFGDGQQVPCLTKPQASVSTTRPLHPAAAPFDPASAAFPAASAATPGSEASAVPTPPQALPASPASTHLWPPPPVPQALPLPQAAPQAALRDEWEYLAPDGVTVYGPFSMRQLLYWAEKGHMDGEVKVRQHSAAGSTAWHPLYTAALATFDTLRKQQTAAAQQAGGRVAPQPTPLPQAAAQAAPPPQPPMPAPIATDSWPPLSHLPVPPPPPEPPASQLLPLAPPPASMPASPRQAHAHGPGLASGLDPAAAHRMWAQATSPRRAVGTPPSSPSVRLAPAAAAAAAAPEESEWPALPSQPPSTSAPKAATNDTLAALEARRKQQVAAVQQAGGWVPPPPPPAAARAPQPLQRQQVTGQGCANGGNGGGSYGRGGNGGKKQKGVGFSDDKEWLLRNGRGKVSGPYTGTEVLSMLNNDTLAEESWVKKIDWKDFKPLEDVEGAIVEMFSHKPQPCASTAAAQRRRDADAENARQGGNGGSGGSSGSGNGGSWSGRSSVTVAKDAALSAKNASQGTLGPGPFRALPGGAHHSVPTPQPQPQRHDSEEKDEQQQDAEEKEEEQEEGEEQGQDDEEGEEEEAGGMPTPGGSVPLLATPGSSCAADAPAASTPASERYTPGQPALNTSLLAEFTPSPAASSSTDRAGGRTGGRALAAVPMQSPGSSGSCSNGDADDDSPVSAPPGLTMQAGLPAAGGPQQTDARKPAFAAWSAAAAADGADGAAGRSA